MHNDDLASMRRALRAAAFGGVLVVLLVTTSSAYLRLRALGLGCEDWPQCYATGVSAVAAPSPARVLHRISAALAGAAVFGIGLIAIMRARDFRRELALAAGMLCLLVALAWLGRSTPGATVPAVAMGNVLGGLVLAALLCWLALDAATSPRRRPGWLPAASWSALLLTFAVIGLGVLTSASHSGLACTALPGCSPEGFPGTWSAAELDPWREAAASASIHMAHRVAALASAVAIALVAWGLRGCAPKLSAAIALLLATQVGLGIALVLGSLPLMAAVLHNVSAALLLLTLVAAQHRSMGLVRH